MLRIIQNTSVAGAKSYYQQSDYYTKDQERPGIWRGDAASRLDLSGDIRQTDWNRLCENLHPRTGEPLTARTNTVRRVGWDFNFHAPKSFSLLYAETQSDALLELFRKNVQSVMELIEDEVKVRVRKEGKNEDRISGNLAWGEFLHFTTRTIDGRPDSHVHAHCFAFNASHDPVEERFKAAAIQDIKRDAPYFEALFHAKLTEDLMKLGLPIERTKSGWEFESVTPELIKKHSRRTAEIEETAKKLGITDAKTKDKLGATTRAGKSPEFTYEQLREEWRGRQTPEEQALLDRLAGRIGGDPVSGEPSAAKLALQQSLDHLLARQSVVPERTVLARAMKLAVGKATAAELVDALNRSDVIRGMRDGRAMVTTREVLGEEMRILKFAREGRGICKPILRKPIQFSRNWLNPEQRNAVRHVVESRSRVMLIRGAAGVGKTSLMQETVEQIQNAGLQVIALAPSADASRGVLREAGFEEADTVARFLLDEKLQSQARGQLIWVDEASMLGSKPMANLFALAEQLDCRVLLTGDRAQHGSVDRGTMLKLLETDAGILPASVCEIQRQKAEYKEAVKLLSEGETERGFDRLDALGWVREVDAESRNHALAKSYVETIEVGKSALVVSPTRKEGAEITHEIRRQLKARGKLGKDEREFVSLVNLHKTEAERQDALSYEVGDVIQFHQNAEGFIKGERHKISDLKNVPTDQATRFNVFKEETIRLAPGDLIRITANGMTLDEAHRLNNGSIYRIKSFDEQNNLVLENGWIVSKDFGKLEYGFSITSHASQGKTVDRVFIGQSSQSFAASNREQFYVSASRGREQAVIYTDSKAELREAIAQTDDRISATEFINGPRLAQILELNQRNRDRQIERHLEQERQLERATNYDR